MDSKELMIGNYVEYKGHIVQWAKSDFCDYTARKLSKPIPLTEQWLIDFGFVKISDQDGTVHYMDFPYPIEGVDIFYQGGDSWEMNIYKVDFSLNIDYVHQLQNLYFALCGKELTK